MSRKVPVYDVEEHSPTLYPKIEGWNEEIVETAGFIPLEVRIKQMEQAGFRAQFFESEFTSKDVTDMYLNHPEFDITAEDDIEEAMEKIEAREAWINKVKEEVRKRNAAETDVNDDEKPKAKKESKNESSAEENS